MSNARAQILGNIRKSLSAGPDDKTRREAVDKRIADHQAGLIPARSNLPKAEQVDLFVRQAEAVQATVDRLAALNDVPEAVDRYLLNHNLPQRLKMAAHETLESLPWDKVPVLTVTEGASKGDDLISLAMAFGGIAETGTLALLSGPDGPTTLNFLPETHLVVLKESDIHGAYEDIWQKLRDRQAAREARDLPRTVNLITGPSRTGDIEQTILLGAHGPHKLHILLVADGE